MKLPPIKIRLPRKPKPILPAPYRPSFAGDAEEVLTGVVNGMKASAGEERFARALAKINAVDGFQFRYTVGAPRNLPGFKEIDFVISARGLVYALEVDTEFTHREKHEADRLHDAIILKELDKQGMNVYPQVIHADGESDLLTQQNADRYAKRLFQ